MELLILWQGNLKTFILEILNAIFLILEGKKRREANFHFKNDHELNNGISS